MSPAQADLIYRNKDQIVDELVSALLARIPDAHVEADGIFRIFFEVLSGALEGNYLALQLLFNDIWVQSADVVALLRFGEMFRFPIKGGTKAQGYVRFEGTGGTYIPVGQQVAAPIGFTDQIEFRTIGSSYIPNPGFPDQPIATDAAVAGNVTGLMEYAWTFVTLEGETALGLSSSAESFTATKVDVTAPIGGVGTLTRKLYRMKDGGLWKYTLTLANNTSVVVQDNIADGSLGGPPPEVSTAERITIAAEAARPGTEGNVVAGTITRLVNVPEGITGVTNASFFSGGSEPQEYEDYRSDLLQYIQDPQSGSPSDLKTWVEEVEGVEEASVFVNMDGVVPRNGHNTIRISGPGAAIPSAGVLDSAIAVLVREDLANITNHVLTFTPVLVDVTVTVELDDGYTLGDVTASAEEAIKTYVNNVHVNKTVYLSGIVDAVFGLPGIINVTVDLPVADVTTTATEKAVADTIVVQV